MWPTPANEASASGGTASSQSARVAEPLGDRAAELEVEVAVGLLGDLAVHRADVVAQLAGVDDGLYLCGHGVS